LHKAFGKKIAVRNLSLSVRRGEIFGFLGPNGAGKSTSIKMLLGLVKPTSGQTSVLGGLSSDPQIRRKIGFLPETFRFYEWLTAAELLSLHGRMCGLAPDELRARVPAMIDLVGLAPHRDKRLQDFSKGMLQRLGLGQALIHQPELIFLDEPTSGLDPMGRRMVRDIIRLQRERGATIFLNSHLLSEIEITCDEVVFIREGEVVTSRDLRAAQSDTETRIVVQARNLTPKMIAELAPWTTDAQLMDGRFTATVPSREHLPEILRHLVLAGAEVYEFTPKQISLEELFVSIMGEDRGL
jgi:ABC-2 type transport system ATP-binding protein